MEKIYVVTYGCYSGYTIDKIFSKREDAERYCALQNTNEGYSFGDTEKELDEEVEFYWECGYKVEEYPLNDVEIVSPTQSLKTRYRYYWYPDREDDVDSYGTIYANKSSIKIALYSKEKVYVVAILDSNLSIEQVKKMIRDEVANYVATTNLL